MKKHNQNNRVILVLLGILLVCFIVLGFTFYKFFYAGTSGTKYGDRLNGIEEYALPKTFKDDINAIYSDNEDIDSVSVDVKGKIIYLIFNFNKTILTNDAKDLATKSLEVVGEENLKFYDVQFILSLTNDDNEDGDEEEDDNNFPIFGAKSANSNKIVW